MLIFLIYAKCSLWIICLDCLHCSIWSYASNWPVNFFSFIVLMWFCSQGCVNFIRHTWGVNFSLKLCKTEIIAKFYETMPMRLHFAICDWPTSSAQPILNRVFFFFLIFCKGAGRSYPREKHIHSFIKYGVSSSFW